MTKYELTVKRFNWATIAIILFAIGYMIGVAQADEMDHTSLDDYITMSKLSNISPRRIRLIERKSVPIVSTIQSYDMAKFTLEEVKHVARKYCGIIIGAEQYKGRTLVYIEWQSPYTTPKDNTYDETKERTYVNHCDTQSN